VLKVDWQPACELQQLRVRAALLADIRLFFQQKGVLEVETPLLCHATGTDPHLDFFSCPFHFPPNDQTLFLQTSPEFAMKRLLAAGSGSIFQICKAFRNAESGRYHNPEFTLLEWYRVGFTLQDLMNEVTELLQSLLTPHLNLTGVQTVSYSQIFKQKTGLDPLSFNRQVYQRYVELHNLPEAVSICGDDHALWLDIIFSHKIQPDLGQEGICLVHSYPASQASLARINPDNSQVSDRFEVFIHGIELGNGFFELADALEQQQRFEDEIQFRHRYGLANVEKDSLFLAALQSGLPECSGIAIGLDRLIMMLTDSSTIDEVLSFPVARA